MINKSRLARVIFCLGSLLIVCLVACGADEVPQATVPGSQAGTPVATAAVTSPAPSIVTPIPTVSRSDAAEIPAASDPGIMDTAEEFGTTRNPLTGEVVADPAILQRRPLAVKISNAPPNFVRPQSGLNAADIVFEHITEGRLTRFTALFYGRDPETIGPIRSARLIDLELPAMYDAALAYSGASNGVTDKLLASDFANRILQSGENGYYRTGDASKPFEHTFYARPEGLRQALESKGLNTPPQFNQYMAFAAEPPAGGTPTSEIRLNYVWEEVMWRYDAANNRYLRFAAGVPHNDGNTNEQVHARNVVVVYATHVDDANICEEIRDNQCHLLSVEVQLWGSGQAVIFRDGQQYTGTWRREGRNDMLTFYDAAGSPIPLQIGNSWFEVMSYAYANSLATMP